MNTTAPFLVMNQPWEQAIVQVYRQLAEVGLHTVRTFDLRDARQAHVGCTCPQHGTRRLRLPDRYPAGLWRRPTAQPGGAWV